MAALQNALLDDDRQLLQRRLDGAKTPGARNRLGQFATPTLLARAIMAHARDLLPADEPIHFLDPAIGTGSFYSALLATFPPERIAHAAGYEIDPHYGEPTQAFWEGSPLDLRLADFTHATPSKRFNLLICNPPYVRHHHLHAAEKLRLQHLTHHATGMRLSGLAGFYCYFLGLAHQWMTDGGLAGWLIPSEFMDVNYGREVKRYLLENVTLLHLHRFDPTDVQFDDALVSSTVVWFRKSPPPAQHHVRFTLGGPLHQPPFSMRIEREALRQIPKWTRLPAMTQERAGAHRLPRVADFFDIRRGVATGANEFFILSPEQVREHQLPDAFLRPILPSPRHLAGDEIFADAAGNPILDRSLSLLDCRLPEAKVRESSTALWKYLQLGIDRGLSLRYLARHRSPWYFQEQRPAAPIVCTYLGRSSDKHGQPFRFFLNHSRATAPNIYLMLYPKPAVLQAIAHQPALLAELWRALKDIDQISLVAEGRVYGGGLHKMEPKELANAPAQRLTALLGLQSQPR